MMEVANKQADIEEAAKVQFQNVKHRPADDYDKPIHDEPKHVQSPDFEKGPKRSSPLKLIPLGRPPSTGKNSTKPSTLHAPSIRTHVTHTLRDSTVLKKELGIPVEYKRPRRNRGDNRRGYQSHDNCNIRDNCCRDGRYNDDRDRRRDDHDNRRRDDHDDQNREERRDQPHQDAQRPGADQNGELQRPKRQVNIMIGGRNAFCSNRKQKLH